MYEVGTFVTKSKIKHKIFFEKSYPCQRKNNISKPYAIIIIFSYLDHRSPLPPLAPWPASPATSRRGATASALSRSEFHKDCCNSDVVKFLYPVVGGEGGITMLFFSRRNYNVVITTRNVCVVVITML